MVESQMFDFKDWYDRVAKLMTDDCVVVECGVANAASALYLAEQLHKAGKRFKLYMVDNLDYGGVWQLKTIYENIIKSELGEYIEVIPKDSVSASKDFNGDSIDFLMLDTSHEYKETKQSLKSWYPKIKDEGYLSGHDYHLYPGVKKAVDELIPEFVTRDILYDENGDISQTFQPTKVLHVEQTDNECGLFWMQKNFFIKLKGTK